MLEMFTQTSKLLYLTLQCNNAFTFKPGTLQFLPHDAMHKRDVYRRVASACPSVRLSHSRILSKRINISSKFFHHG